MAEQTLHESLNEGHTNLSLVFHIHDKENNECDYDYFPAEKCGKINKFPMMGRFVEIRPPKPMDNF